MPPYVLLLPVRQLLLLLKTGGAHGSYLRSQIRVIIPDVSLFQEDCSQPHKPAVLHFLYLNNDK